MKARGDTLKKNVGKTDGYIRYIIGIILIFLSITWHWSLVIPAVIAISTSFFGVCGIYAVFGINTCKKD